MTEKLLTRTFSFKQKKVVLDEFKIWPDKRCSKTIPSTQNGENCTSTCYRLRTTQNILGLFCLKDHCPLGYLFRVGTKMLGESHDMIKQFNPNSFTLGKHAHAIFSDFSRL